MAKQAIPVEARFWAKVDRRGPDECWPWTASTDRDGYGQLWQGDGSRRLLIAHRFSWELHVGPIPPAGQVLHSCDNPPCVNPAHLFLGDPAANMADRDAKGRHRSGYDTIPGFRPNARLTEGQVREIRARAASGESQSVLAARFGVSQQTISLVVRRVVWADVG